MASLLPQKPIEYYESLSWEQLNEELNEVYKCIKKDRLGCPDPTMAEETVINKITELMKKNQMKYMKKKKKNVRNIQSHIINNWIKKKLSKKLQKEVNKKYVIPTKILKV